MHKHISSTFGSLAQFTAYLRALVGRLLAPEAIQRGVRIRIPFQFCSEWTGGGKNHPRGSGILQAHEGCIRGLVCQPAGVPC